MTPEQLQAELEKAKQTLRTEQNAEAKAAVAEEIKKLEAQLNQIKTLETENATLKGRIEKLETAATANQEVIDKMAKGEQPGAVKGDATNFEEALGAGLQKRAKDLEAYRNGSGKGFTIIIGKKGDPAVMKTVGDMTSSGSLTGSYFVPPTLVPGVTMQPYEEVHMRNVLPVGSTTSNLIRYVRDLGGEGGPAMVAEGAAKPQMDRDLQIFDANVRKIATHFRVPEEMIDDIPYLQSFLSQIGVEELMAVEDTQILYGTGSGQNLSGLFTNATLFNPGTSVVTSPNEFDVIRAARKQLRKAKLGGPLVALVSPTDFFNMTSRKDSTNNYLFLGGGNGIQLANPSATPTGINAGGVQVEEHTAITDGDFLVFQPRSAAIFDRAATSIRLYDQDQDNAIKNLITIVIEKRLALPIYRPAGFIKGTFTSAISDLGLASATD